MSRDTLSILKRHLQEKKHSVVLNIIQEHLYFDMYEGVARNKQQIEATAGAVVGEATRQGEWSCGVTDGSKHSVCDILDCGLHGYEVCSREIVVFQRNLEF
jgi:hypothetical protein